MIASNKRATGQTRVCQVGDEKGGQLLINSERVVRLLRSTCTTFGKIHSYGMVEKDLGTRSIRSGAAMALFLNDHSPEKIKILGRWSSDAFMVYIRPQVLEWTNIMATDMARTHDFMDLSRRSRSRSARRQKWKKSGTMPPFHLRH